MLPFILPMIGALYSVFFQNKIGPILLLFFSLVFSFWLCVKTFEGELIVSFAGGWLAPFGITCVIDMFSAMMLVGSNTVFLLSSLFGFSEKSHSFRLPLIFLLQAGVSLSFITADFFNLFVSFEIMLTASYALLICEVPIEKREKMFFYIMINVIGSFLFLSLSAVLYGATGHLNMASVHLLLQENSDGVVVFLLAAFGLVIFGLKAGLFPLYFWLPETYPKLPPSLVALFGGVLTKVGVYVLIRLFVTILPHSLHAFYYVILTCSALTMFLGVLGAICQKKIKNILSYHILSQIGYMTFSLGMFFSKSLAAGLIFLFHNMIVKSSLFLIGGEVVKKGGGENLGQIKGVWKNYPWLGICFLLQALSLAGIPPLSGFWGKYLLFQEALQNEHYILLTFAFVTSFWTLFSMIKIWMGAFFAESQVEKKEPLSLPTTLAIILSVAASVCLGLFVEVPFEFVNRAAEQLFDPNIYVKGVLSK
jgi:multicomponent Na+:H+ antiporter subunit D